MLFITEVLCIDELKTKPLASSCHNCSFKYIPTIHVTTVRYQGRIQEGRTRHAPPPLKLDKIWFFGVKSWFFTRNTPTIFAPPSAIGKNMNFWRKIVIFHTKYRKNVRTSLRSAHSFLSAPLLTWNSGSAPGYMWGYAL